ncbi:GNAT family N-acetyltransferase [Patescibacteria group bacterium]|nr:GNAT family N-acetyltransferase [Patescibacteria group bacterium]
MIHQLTDKTELKIFQKIVDIHRLCISQSNAPYYSPEVIEEWLEEVNTEDTINQLKYTTWVALEKENNIVGFAQYSLPDRELYQIQIDPTLQRKGYGKELYEYIEEEFKKNNIKEMGLYSVKNAIEFYKSLGFKKKRKIFFPLKKTKTELEVMTKKLG